MVARSRVLSRASTVWAPGTVPYSQVRTHSPDGYRCDCSGYVCMCWEMATPGQNTVTLVTQGWMTEIPIESLLPGDAVGLCGPGTAGDAGHIQLVESWTPTAVVIWEQAGGGNGPTRRMLKRVNPGYKAYRYKGIEGGGSDVLDYQDVSDIVRLILNGTTDAGYVQAAGKYKDTPLALQAATYNLDVVKKELEKKIAAIATTPVDVAALAALLAEKLASDPVFLANVAKATNDDTWHRMAP